MRRDPPLDDGKSVGPARIKAGPPRYVSQTPLRSPPNKMAHKCLGSHLPEVVLDGGIIKLTAGHCICDHKHISRGGGGGLASVIARRHTWRAERTQR